MENYDPQVAQRVWKRVLDGPAREEMPQLQALIIGEWQDAATYLQLSRRLQGSAAQRLRKMFEEEQAHGACLKGIYSLVTGERPRVKAPPVSQDSVKAILRRCYGREMQCLAAYEQWSGHREYGPVFARLAQQEREHCRILLEILGSLPGK